MRRRTKAGSLTPDEIMAESRRRAGLPPVAPSSVRLVLHDGHDVVGVGLDEHAAVRLARAAGLVAPPPLAAQLREVEAILDDALDIEAGGGVSGEAHDRVVEKLRILAARLRGGL